MIPKKHNMASSYVIFEFLLLNFCIITSLVIKFPEAIYFDISKGLLYDFVGLILLFNITWIFIILFRGDPRFYYNYSFPKQVKYLTINTFIFVGICSTIAILFKMDYINRTIFLLPVVLFSFLNLFFFRFLFEYFIKKRYIKFNSNILFIGGGDKWQKVLDFTRKIRHLGYTNVGFLYNEHTKIKHYTSSGVNILGPLHDLPNVLDTKPIDEIFVSSSSVKQRELKSIIKTADFRGVRVNLIPEATLETGKTFKSHNLDGHPVFQHRKSPLDDFNNFLAKKMFDFCFSFSVLLFLSPLLLFISLLIYMDGKGSIFYKPLRKGEAGKPFRCYKFRTMSICDNPLNGTKSTVENDPRITKIGKYLRKYDLDELPQFFNVLIGDMSVVGPRPHRVNLQKDFRKIVNDYMVRHYVKPGITGWAQVNGWRGPTVTAKQKKERIKHDLWYIENWNFWLDFKIIFLTVFGKKVRKNAF